MIVNRAMEDRLVYCLSPSTPKSAEVKIQEKSEILFCKILKNKLYHEEVHEWSHHRISSTDSKVRTSLHVSIIEKTSDSGVSVLKPRESRGYK